MKKIPLRYLPKSLSSRDRKKQINALKKSKKMYKSHKYYQRPKIRSFFSKTSKHVRNAQKIYGIDKITPGEELAKKSGCSVLALRKIVNKGEGAYYSSGSRPNQTARSWGLARLASALTGGKSAAVDYNIIANGCKHTGKAYRMANMAKKKYGHGHGKTKKVIIKGGDSMFKEYDEGIYIGHLKDNKRNGLGQMTYKNGDIYRGEWKDDEKHGDGIIIKKNGIIDKEKWEKGELIETIAIEKSELEKILKKITNSLPEKSSKKSEKTPNNEKPSIIKSAPNTIQMSGTCVAHSISRSITRTFLLLTLIDGNKSEEMFTALYCYYLKFAKIELLNELGISVTNPAPKTITKPAPITSTIPPNPPNPKLEQDLSVAIKHLTERIAEQVSNPIEEPLVESSNNPPTESVSESQPVRPQESRLKQKSKFFKPLDLRRFFRRRKGGHKADIINKIICEKSGKTIFYKLFIDKLKNNISALFDCKYSEIPCEYIVGGCIIEKKDSYILNFTDDEKKEFINKFRKLNDSLLYKQIQYEYNPNSNNLPTLEIKEALNKRIQPIISLKCHGNDKPGHSFILRSWGKEYDEYGNEIQVKNNRFCYKNTWVFDTNDCVDDINELCKKLYSNTNDKIIPVTKLEFIFLDFDLENIRRRDENLYKNIIDRRDIIYRSVYDDDNTISDKKN